MSGEKGSKQRRSLKDRFWSRHKLLSGRNQALQVAHDIRVLIASGQTDGLRELVAQLHPADLALTMRFLYDAEKDVVFRVLDVEEAAEVLDEADAATEEHLVGSTEPERLADILEELPPDEGADIVGEMEEEQAERVLKLMEEEESQEIRQLLKYPPDTAGGIMTSEFVAVPEEATREEALELIQQRADAESIFYVYVVSSHGALKGVLDLRRLLTALPGTQMKEIVTHGVVFVHPDFDQEQVADIFARYDLLAMPVVEPPPSYKLIGVITADDIIDVIHEEHAEDQLRMAGTDVEELETKSPLEAAKVRLPWVFGSLFISMMTGTVVAFFHGTLSKVILLASFMPVISAMAGNVGVQSATVMVRSMAISDVAARHLRHLVLRELRAASLMGLVCGLVLGTVGALWDGRWQFGAIVSAAMFCAMSTAGVLGALLPVIFKRFRIDPAISASPLVTNVQDIVGVATFLGLATLFLHWLER